MHGHYRGSYERRAGESMWTLALFLGIVASDLYLIHVDVWGKISPRNLFILLLAQAFVAGMLLRKGLRLNPLIVPMMWLILIFSANVIFVNAIHGIKWQVTFYEIALLLVGLIIASTVFAVSRFRGPEWIVRIIVAGLTVSAAVALLQFSNIDFFWTLRLATGLGPSDVVATQLLERTRVPGLAYYSVTLASQLVWGIPMAFAFALRAPRRSMRRRIWSLAVGLLLAGVLVTLSRSAVVGALIGVGATLAFAPRQWRPSTPVLIKAVLLFAAIATVIVGGTRLLTLEELVPRYGMLETGVSVALSHPLGIGEGRLSEVLQAESTRYDHIEGSERLLTTSTHNYFLNTAITYGLLGAALAAAQVVIIFNMIRRGIGRSSGNVKLAVVVGIAGGWVAYLFNTMFHNAGPLDGHTIPWYFIGLLASCLRRPGVRGERQEVANRAPG